MNDDSYIISGGMEGKTRLNILSETLYPYTLPFLKSSGLTSGQSFLDVGCGGGNVTLAAAELVANSGRATGVDFDAQLIELAREDAVKTAAHNVTFLAGSAYDIDFDNEFDVVYSRFLLSHLQSPETALDKMIRSAKQGGVILVEDTHFIGHLCYPHCPAFNAYVRMYQLASRNNGHDPNIGPSLYSMFIRAGLKDVSFDVILPCFSNGTGKWMAYLTLDRIKGTLVKQQLAEEEEITSWLEEIAAFTKDEQTIISMPHIFRVRGVKS
jgi:ubiquinone/menaquinone biosynthesis C-methylase UbiE